MSRLTASTELMNAGTRTWCHHRRCCRRKTWTCRSSSWVRVGHPPRRRSPRCSGSPHRSRPYPLRSPLSQTSPSSHLSNNTVSQSSVAMTGSTHPTPPQTGAGTRNQVIWIIYLFILSTFVGLYAAFEPLSATGSPSYLWPLNYTTPPSEYRLIPPFIYS